MPGVIENGNAVFLGENWVWGVLDDGNWAISKNGCCLWEVSSLPLNLTPPFPTSDSMNFTYYCNNMSSQPWRGARSAFPLPMAAQRSCAIPFRQRYVLSFIPALLRHSRSPYCHSCSLLSFPLFLVIPAQAGIQKYLDKIH